ncbi:MAG: hypothetical protein U0640_08875 [Phycisphaerales bacterium]
MQIESVSQQLTSEQVQPEVKQTKEPLKITALGYVPFVLVGVITVLVQAFKPTNTLGPGIGVAASFLGLVIWYVILTLIARGAFHIFRRSQKAGNIAFASLPTLALVSGLVVGVTQGGWRKNVDTQLQAMDVQSKQVAASGDLGAQADYSKQVAEKTRALAEQGSGNERASLLALSKVAEYSASLLEAYSKAAAPVLDPVFLSGAAIKTTEDCDRRIAALDAARRANAVLRDKQSKMFETVADIAAGEGLNREQVLHDVRLAFPPHRHAALLRVRDTDDELYVALQGQFQLLRESMGRWHYDTLQGQMLFEDDEVMQRYNEYANRIVSVAKEQESLTQIAAGLDTRPDWTSKENADAAQVRSAANDPAIHNASDMKTPEGRDAVALQALTTASRRLDELAERANGFDSRLRGYQYYGSFARREQFKAFDSVLKQYVEARIAYRAELAAMPEKLRAELLKVGFSAAEATTRTEELYGAAQTKAVVDYYDRDIQLSKAIQAEANYLETTFGAWKFSRSNGGIRFTDAAKQKHYDRLSETNSNATKNLELARLVVAGMIEAKDKAANTTQMAEIPDPKF